MFALLLVVAAPDPAKRRATWPHGAQGSLSGKKQPSKVWGLQYFQINVLQPFHPNI
ncbi:MAG: hypothetical protein UV96_C0041G0004 [Parcubacteria group bacterium GW2011_GWF2_43_38]|nr:MAG: hypothetical protein UV96_C0041G0004 [Parcubacteria group bacterium GW2011_GWF2_43_38]